MYLMVFSTAANMYPLYYHREAAILVTPTTLQPSDKGSVIVGGRLSIQSDPLFRKSEQIKDKMNVRKET